MSKPSNTKGNAAAGREGRSSRNWWSAWKWAEGILLTCGLSLLALYGAVRFEGYLSSRAALKDFAALESSAPAEVNSLEEDNSSAGADFSNWNENRIRAYKESLANQHGAPMAVLQIPRIHLAVPLLDGTDDLTLNHAVGHIAGTARPGEQGNIGIAGHRDGFFRGLKDLKAGDEIDLRTLSGTDKYAVDQIRIVTPDNVGVLKPRPIPSLTLVTCYPFYFIGSAPQRYIVMASLTHETSSGSGSSTPDSASPTGNTNKENTMINFNSAQRIFARNSAFAAILAMVSIGAWAQDLTTTSVRHGEKSYNTEVKNAEVVYVEGNDLVLKLRNGKVEHLVVPDSDVFKINGKDVSVHELTKGTKLTQIITTSTAPRYVTTVRTLEGKVWHVNAPRSVIVSLPDNTNKAFEIPKNAKFIVNGTEKTVFDLRKGMKFKATIVTDDTETVVARDKTVHGLAPTPTVLPAVGVLLIQRPAPPAPVAAPVMVASAEPLAATLPKTGTALPLAGLLGVLSLAGSFGLKLARKKVTN